ncbi:hypothetical protein L1987_85058 [Smallanthus sonchifolius]|uniref:Uncharacterized protein n=1 Tax=Smallanthus sonchifolius TaxID=185202 RepID=A0ACB8XW40_9ASTR|nr:hypothetical protein L1987_85058 [Smallanthus sonchifolius]
MRGSLDEALTNTQKEKHQTLIRMIARKGISMALFWSAASEFGYLAELPQLGFVQTLFSPELDLIVKPPPMPDNSFTGRRLSLPISTSVEQVFTPVPRHILSVWLSYTLRVTSLSIIIVPESLLGKQHLGRATILWVALLPRYSLPDLYSSLTIFAGASFKLAGGVLLEPAWFLLIFVGVLSKDCATRRSSLKTPALPLRMFVKPGTTGRGVSRTPASPPGR